MAVACLSVMSAAAVFGLGIGPAVADISAQPSATTSVGAGSDSSRLYADVHWTKRGIPKGGGSQPIASSNANWSPPVCWYKSFTPEQFEAEIERRYIEAGQANAGTVYNYYYEIQSQMNEIDYHKGDHGSWWVLEWNPSVEISPGSICPYDTGWLWQGPADPAPPAPVTPEILAQAAYGETRLPMRTVALSPRADNQKVNLATYVKFAEAIPEVSVTASLDGVSATVVAVPYSLHIDAGTPYASPTSCDYTFAQSGGGYTVDSSDAGCNVTYRKATAASSTYELQARITWRVSWTPTAEPQPGGTPLDDGYSTYPQPVRVQEIQAVNR